jgi:hypothetical protein
MKLLKHTFLLSLFTISSLLLTGQRKIGIDVAAIRNHTTKQNGINLSAFYFLNKKLSTGIEINRFFPTLKSKHNGSYRISAWDYDWNIHFNNSIGKFWTIYPLTGISYTVEKEQNQQNAEPVRTGRFYFNAGAGILLNTKRVRPHLEYFLATNRKTEHYLLVGISYEFEWNNYR